MSDTHVYNLAEIKQLCNSQTGIPIREARIHYDPKSEGYVTQIVSIDGQFIFIVGQKGETMVRKRLDKLMGSLKRTLPHLRRIVVQT